MNLELSKKPSAPTIIHGFPGFGMVGAIATEYLIEHLGVEQIGRIAFEQGPALTAIHDGKVVEPFGIFYSKKHNIVLVHAILSPKEHEWELAGTVIDLAKQLKAKEIISLEGVGSPGLEHEPKVFYHTTSAAAKKKLFRAQLEPMSEGIILGITAALLVKAKKQQLTCLFAETSSGLPDSKAAAKIIEALDQYLNLKVDYKPLLKLAAQFEDKLKSIMQQSQSVQDERERKQMSYVG